MGMKAVHGAGHYFCFSSITSPLSSLTGRGNDPGTGFALPRARRAISWAPLLPGGMTFLPLWHWRGGETSGSKPQWAIGTMEGLRGGQGEQDGHWQMCNRASGLKIPSASVPKVAI